MSGFSEGLIQLKQLNIAPSNPSNNRLRIFSLTDSSFNIVYSDGTVKRLDNGTPLTVTAAISAGLQSQINSDRANYTLNTTTSAISAGLQNQITNNNNSLNNYTLTTTTSAISAGLQSQINSTRANYTLNTTTALISAGLQTQITNTSNALTTYTTLVNTAAVSAGLQKNINDNYNALNNYTLNTSTAAISAGLVSSISYKTSRNMRTYTQNGHPFSNGSIVAYNGSAWVFAQSNNPNNSEAIGIVENTTSTTFDVVTSGYIYLYSQSLTPGNVYFVSDTLAGTLSVTEPTTQGSVSKPICFAISSTEAIVYSMRGTIVSGIQYVDTSTVQSISGIKSFNDTISINAGVTEAISVISISAYAIQSSEITLLCNYARGNQVLTLPTSPYHGRKIDIKKIVNTPYQIILQANSVNIEGSSNNYTFTNYNQAVSIKYCGTPGNIGWFVF